MNSCPTAHADPKLLTAHDKLGIGNELVHIGNLYLLVNDNGSLGIGFCLWNVDVDERLDIWFGILQEQRRSETVNSRVKATVAFC